MKYKTNLLNLLFTLYRIEDKKQYSCKSISKYIDKLQEKKEKKEMEKQVKFVIYNRKTGNKDSKCYDTLKEAINEACKRNDAMNSYNFLVTSVKK